MGRRALVAEMAALRDENARMRTAIDRRDIQVGELRVERDEAVRQATGLLLELQALRALQRGLSIADKAMPEGAA